MSIPRRLVFSVLAAISLAGAAVSAAEAPLPDGWAVIGMPGKAITQFKALPDGGIAVTSDNSVGFLYRDTTVVPGTGRFLTWRWRVDAAPPATDLSAKGMDDRPLAIHVWFKDEGNSGAGWDLQTRLGAWILRKPLPGKTLTYVWGGMAARGTTLRNPYREKDGRIIVLRQSDGAIGRWFSEMVDIAADFERAFGYPPGRPAYVAISADTDDKGGRSAGVVADIVFKSAL